MDAITGSSLECLLIADDLTGACDSAVHFAARGRSYGGVPGSRCGSRGAGRAGRSAPIRAMRRPRSSAAWPARPRAGSRAARSAWYSRRSIRRCAEAPRGDPRGRRSVRLRGGRGDARFSGDGPHRAGGLPAGRPGRGFRAHPLAFLLSRRRAWNACTCAPGAVREPWRPARATFRWTRPRTADLDAIAREVLAVGPQGPVGRIGRIGCGAGAGRLPGAFRVRPSARARGAVLFCIGSDHAVTLEQQRRLVAERGAVAGHAPTTAAPEAIRDALARGEHVVLRIPRGRGLLPALRDLRGRAAALLLSGGDTASAVCRALGARRIELRGEIVPGIPCGRFRRGPARRRARGHQVRRFRRPRRIAGGGRYFGACPCGLTRILRCC